METYNKNDSRKYKLALYTLWTSTLMTLLPPLLTYCIFKNAIVIMTGTEWVAVNSAVLLFYNSANVAQKVYADKNLNASKKE